MKTTSVLVATLLLGTLLSTAKANCPDCTQHADGALLRDPTSCSHYYKCVQGRSERKSCGSGFYFDERFLICNFAAFVDCKNSEIIVDPPAPTTAPTCHNNHHHHHPTTCKTTPAPICKPTTTCEPTTCAPPAPPPAIDPESCDPITHKPAIDPETCDAITHKPAIDPESCDPITHKPAIDPDQCDDPTPPPCDSNHNSNYDVVDTLRRLSDCKSLKDDTYLFDRKHCRRYYVCRAGRARHERCSYGQWFDGHTKTCRSKRYVSNCPANRD